MKKLRNNLNLNMMTQKEITDERQQKYLDFVTGLSLIKNNMQQKEADELKILSNAKGSLSRNTLALRKTSMFSI